MVLAPFLVLERPLVLWLEFSLALRPLGISLYALGKTPLPLRTSPRQGHYPGYSYPSHERASHPRRYRKQPFQWLLTFHHKRRFFFQRLIVERLTDESQAVMEPGRQPFLEQRKFFRRFFVGQLLEPEQQFLFVGRRQFQLVSQRRRLFLRRRMEPWRRLFPLLQRAFRRHPSIVSHLENYGHEKQYNT